MNSARQIAISWNSQLVYNNQTAVLIAPIASPFLGGGTLCVTEMGAITLAWLTKQLDSQAFQSKNTHNVS